MEYSELKKRHFGTNDTDKKLTDEEIISSLEVIAATRNCDECKIRNCKWGTCNCSQITANAALELINRQKTEIENLKDILYDADGVNLVNYWYQQCEIAENGNRNFDEENKKLKVEIKRLKNDISAMLVTLRNSAKATRNEAIKEFAERLKKETLSDRGYDILQQGTIDNLLKEMVGERRITDNQEAEKALEKMK